MARLAVYSLNPVHPDKKRQPQKYQRGDVIERFEDGESFGAIVESSPMFRIIEIPGVSADHPDLVGLSYREGAKGIGHKRLNAIDLDGIERWAEKKLKRSLAADEAVILKTTTAVKAQLLDKIARKRKAGH